MIFVTCYLFPFNFANENYTRKYETDSIYAPWIGNSLFSLECSDWIGLSISVTISTAVIYWLRRHSIIVLHSIEVFFFLSSIERHRSRFIFFFLFRKIAYMLLLQDRPLISVDEKIVYHLYKLAKTRTFSNTNTYLYFFHFQTLLSQDFSESAVNFSLLFLTNVYMFSHQFNATVTNNQRKFQCSASTTYWHKSENNFQPWKLLFLFFPSLIIRRWTQTKPLTATTK